MVVRRKPLTDATDRLASLVDLGLLVDGELARGRAARVWRGSFEQLMQERGKDVGRRRRAEKGEERTCNPAP